jgi:hypothetical protein
MTEYVVEIQPDFLERQNPPEKPIKRSAPPRAVKSPIIALGKGAGTFRPAVLRPNNG